MRQPVKFFKFLLWILLAGTSGAALIGSSASLYLAPSLPSVDSLKDAKLQTPLRVYSADRLLMAEYGEQRRDPIDFEEIPSAMIKAFMAAEDDRFYQHPGVDIIGLTRAAIQLVTSGSIKSGGSTITMQVAKNFFLSHERVFSRKFNEILLALQIEQQLTKNEILELYLNKIYLGNRAYGVEAAAQAYYDKSIRELDLAQIAMIAGLPKAPSSYNPLSNPERAIIRRNWILNRMHTLNYITQSQYDQAIQQPITARHHRAPVELEAPYVAEMVRQKMVDKYGDAAYTDGYDVYTTVQSKLQLAANDAITEGLMTYNERHGYTGAVANHSPFQWQQVLKTTHSNGVLVPAIVNEVAEDQVSILLPDDQSNSISWENMAWARRFLNVNAMAAKPEKPSDVLKVGDQIWVRLVEDSQYRLAQPATAQGALVSIRPDDGAIYALVGGYSFYESMYNRATQAIRQAGSSFKPFIYAAALDSGMTAASIINDAPIIYDNGDFDDSWRPKNDNSRFNGPTRLREGLYRSRNLVSIRILRELGVNNAIKFLTGLGFEKDALSHDLSLALGNTSMTPLAFTSRYATLANGGFKIEPYFIDRIEQKDEVIFQANPAIACNDECAAQQSALMNSEFSTIVQFDNGINAKPHYAEAVMSPQVNYIITDITRDVITKGTGKRALVLKRDDLSGKTGTSNESKDVWFSGFMPDIVTAVWVGMDNNSTLGRWEYGANTALPIWINYMRVALADFPERHHQQPEGIVSLKISTETGELADPGDPNAIFEIFRAENAPTKHSAPSIPAAGQGGLTPDDIF